MDRQQATARWYWQNQIRRQTIVNAVRQMMPYAAAGSDNIAEEQQEAIDESQANNDIDIPENVDEPQVKNNENETDEPSENNDNNGSNVNPGIDDLTPVDDGEILSF